MVLTNAERKRRHLARFKAQTYCADRPEVTPERMKNLKAAGVLPQEYPTAADLKLAIERLLDKLGERVP